MNITTAGATLRPFFFLQAIRGSSSIVHSSILIPLFLAAIGLHAQQAPTDFLSRLPEHRELTVPYELDESSIILPPGSWVSDDLHPLLLGDDPGRWHVWIVGTLQGFDSVVPMVLKFEGNESDYVDVYFLVVFDLQGSRIRTDLLGVFANVNGDYSTSHAVIDSSLHVTRSIEW